MKWIFVDAYNVINSWPNFKEFKDLDFGVARDKFIDIMENYAVYNNYSIVLVFDAHNSKKNGNRKLEISKNLTVIYTDEGEIADTRIERIIDKMGKKTDVSVVTSDYLEQQTVFQRGASRISSLDFYKEVCEVSSKIEKGIYKINSTNKKFILADNLDDRIIDKLEKIRKGK